MGSQSSTSSNCHVVERSETISATAPHTEASSAKCRKTSAGILGASTSHFDKLLPRGTAERRPSRPNPSSFQLILPLPPTLSTCVVASSWSSRETHVASPLLRRSFSHKSSKSARGRLLLALRILLRASPGSQPAPRGGESRRVLNYRLLRCMNSRYPANLFG